MRRVNLTKEEATLMYTILNQGDPQKGLSLQDVRTMVPIMDKLEVGSVDKKYPNGEVGLELVPQELELKESEYSTVIGKVSQSSGWVNVAMGRKVLALDDKLKELAKEEDPKVEEGDKK